MAADFAALLPVPFFRVPLWLAVFVVSASIVVALFFISDYAVEDLILDEEEFRARIESMFRDNPEMLASLNDPIAEPACSSAVAAPVGSLFNEEDLRSHRRLTSSRSTDRKVLRLCGDEALYGLPLSEIARSYGKTEEELVLFLYARRPGLLYRRNYFRAVASMNSRAGS